MLSTEKSPPPGPSETTPQLKSSCKNFIITSDDDDDERSFDNGNKVDLFQSGLEDINQTVPKFSIRDYVFSTRAKDIETHWPFSSKNLKLCLKHGVKDVLPPFETLESVRINQSPAVKNADRNTSLRSSVKLSELNAHLHSVANKNACLNLIASDTNRAIKSNAPAKTCRLIVKLGNNTFTEQKSNEADLLENTTMGSKVCPVCKTFASSSNTTLNAHIDQCLSEESNTKWVANSRVVKHRIKPRKTRLMVDIYETALSCTLEDLDRRNGTNWASNGGFSPQESENNVNSNTNNASFSTNGEDKKSEAGGDVYFDSHGTKLRILSRFTDSKSNYTNEEEAECGTRKLLSHRDKDKESEIVPGKKKKHLAQRSKLLKHPLFVKRRFSPRLERCPEVNYTQKNEKELPARLLDARGHHMKTNGSEILTKHWACSKRTGLEENKITKKPRMSSHDLLSVDEKLTKRTNDSRFSISCDDDNSDSDTDQTLKSKESTDSKSAAEYMPCQINRAGFFSFVPRDFRNDGNKQYHHTVMQNLESNDFKGVKESEPSSFSGAENGAAAFRRNKKMRRIIISSTFERQKLMSPLNKKNPSSMNHISLSESRKILRKKKFAFKKPRLHFTSEIHVQQAESDSRNLSINPFGVSKIRKEKRGFLNLSRKDMDLYEYSEPNSRVAEQDINSSLTDTTPACSPVAIEAIEIRDELVREPILEVPPVIAAFGEESLVHEEREQEMLCSDKFDQQGNYFIDVDPIPIPGPPGSFIPSPGRMGSEELQGSSSLTSFRAHSPEHDRPRSDSPSSNKSFVSSSINPVVERPFLFENDHPALDKPKIDWPRANSAIPVPSATTNPVLRLMGKNLMVVNREENLACNDFRNLQSSGGIQNDDCPPPSYHNNSCVVGPPFLDYSRFHPNFMANPSRVMISSRINSNEGLRSSFEFLDHHQPRQISPGFERSPHFVPQPTITTNHLPEGRSSSVFKTTYHENLEDVGGFGCQTWGYPVHFGSWKTTESANNTTKMPSFQGANGSSTGHERSPSNLHLSRGFSLHANFARAELGFKKRSRAKAIGLNL
ncbi:hapless 8 [Striga hermonthica]|uniref:Hapless 8 n=1 Tax=Striga hermonthica TaxID=68872 RepID=A0A9N7RPX2_STRHE|nr:hapless 8 [Striga hermonthica]